MEFPPLLDASLVKDETDSTDEAFYESLDLMIAKPLDKEEINSDVATQESTAVTAPSGTVGESGESVVNYDHLLYLFYWVELWMIPQRYLGYCLCQSYRQD